MRVIGFSAPLAACGLFLLTDSTVEAPPAPDVAALAAASVCRAPGFSSVAARPFLLAQGETRPFTADAVPSGGTSTGSDRPPLFDDLGTLSMPVSTSSDEAQRYFDQGLRLAFAFNHVEARRAFVEAQRLDSDCAMCFWGEALVLGPNINAPMFPDAHAPALRATERAQSLAADATPREQALIGALSKRYGDDPAAERKALDVAYADAMAEVAGRFPDDDHVQVLYAEALMDVSPWDYWEADGVRPKGRAGEMIAALETVLVRNPVHPGAIHLYIHAVEASADPERALLHARRLAALMPGAGHIVHMPGHIYYRIGLYREALEANVDAVAADERYFAVSESDPFYRNGYYPHNLHFLIASAQMGGDGKTALEVAEKLDRVIDADFLRAAAALQPVKAAPYFTHAQFSDAETILALEDPGEEFVLVRALWRYARALAYSTQENYDGAEAEIAALAATEAEADFSELEEWGVPGGDVVRTARLVAEGRLASARGDLEGAATAYRAAIAVENRLSYMEPPYWYYPVRQSLGAVLLRMGQAEAAERAFRDSLERVPNNGWALYGLQQTLRARGDVAGAQAAGEQLERAWFGDPALLDVERL